MHYASIYIKLKLRAVGQTASHNTGKDERRKKKPSLSNQKKIYFNGVDEK